jgi:TetR/AcrR family transcriptional regulator, cholesterol catabolism regulator
VSASASASTDKRAQLIDAAIRSFSERGYRGTSMRDLARDVNLSKPAIYHYVESKEALLVEIYEGVTAEGVEFARQMLERDVKPLDAIRGLLVERISYTCENRNLVRIFFEEETEIPESLTRAMLEQRRAYEDAFIELLNRGVADGSMHFDTTPRIVVNVMLGAAHWSYKWYNPRGSKSAQQLGEEMADMLLEGLKVRA